jgi:peptidoglycan/xylan/chitin deacetylase (PgdA/CDA1 family)
MYHRIAEAELDPWNICVQPDRFDDQLRALRRFADVVPLASLPAAMTCGRGRRPVVAITFDDGYVDNLTRAKPVLERHEAPATVFLATGCIDQGQPFWWDVVTDLVLGADRLPRELDLEDVGTAAFHRCDPSLEEAGDAGRAARLRLHDELWEWLVVQNEPDRRDALRRLTSWSARRSARDPSALPMSTPQVRELLRGGLISAGSHTAGHVRLADLRREDKLREIERGRVDCERLTGAHPVGFAYPFGCVDDESVECVREAGFRCACTSEADLAWADGDPLRVPRLLVDNRPGDRLVRALHWYWFA